MKNPKMSSNFCLAGRLDLKSGKRCSLGERNKLISLFEQYKDVFSWTYEELKTYDTKIIQHVIPIRS